MPETKLKAFSNGARYVEAGEGAKFLTWLIDFVVYLLGVAVGVVAVAMVDRSQGLGGGVIALALLALLFVVPVVYGLFYFNGRGLGAVMTGTRLVRLEDGGRIGAKGPWAMLIRTVLLPLLILGAVLGGGVADGTLKRVSISVKRTRRLYEQGDLLPR